MALIVFGIILMGIGVYALSKVPLTAISLNFEFLGYWLSSLQSINWAVVGFVTILGSAAVLGSAFVVSRVVK
jgi:hypothetical protein